MVVDEALIDTLALQSPATHDHPVNLETAIFQVLNINSVQNPPKKIIKKVCMYYDDAFVIYLLRSFLVRKALKLREGKGRKKHRIIFSFSSPASNFQHQKKDKAMFFIHIPYLHPLRALPVADLVQGGALAGDVLLN